MLKHARLLALAVLALLGAATASHAQSTCPQGTANTVNAVTPTDIDGCQGAPPDGIFIQPQFFTARTNGVYQQGVARESGQTYAHTTASPNGRPTINVAGVDYGVGYSPSQVAAGVAAAVALNPSIVSASNPGWKDPKKIALESSTKTHGCSVNLTSGAEGGPAITCAGAGSDVLDIEDYDLSMYHCTPLVVQGGYSSITVKNNNVKNGNNCINSGTAWGIASQGDSWNGYVLDNFWIGSGGVPDTGHGVICIDLRPGHQAQGTDAFVPTNTIINIGNQVGSGEGWTAVVGNAYNSDACAANYTAYTVAGGFLGDPPHGGWQIGSSVAPLQITQANSTVNVTITNGSIVAGMQYQGGLTSGTVSNPCTGVTAAGATVANCSSPVGPGAYQFAAGGTGYSPTTRYLFGPATNTSPNPYQPPLQIGNGTAPYILFTQNLADMNQVGSTSWTSAFPSAFSLNGSGTIIADYNAVVRCNCRPVSMSFGGTAFPFTAELNWNYFEEWGLSINDAGGGHNELMLVGTPASTHNAVFALYQTTGNTVLTTSDLTTDLGAESPFWFNTLAADNSGVIQLGIVSFNTSITNWTIPWLSNNNGVPKTSFTTYAQNMDGSLMDVLDTTVNVLNVHDDWVDPTGLTLGGLGTQGYGCAPFWEFNTGFSTGRVLTLNYGNDYDLVTGNVQNTTPQSTYFPQSASSQGTACQ